MIMAYLISNPQFNIWNISYITSTSILHGLIRTHKWPAPNVSGFIAQLVRALHRYREVTGSNPVEVLTFSGFCSQLLKLRSKLPWSWLTWFQIRSSIYETFHTVHITSHYLYITIITERTSKTHAFNFLSRRISKPRISKQALPLLWLGKQVL